MRRHNTLHGLRVLNTRPLEQSHALEQAIDAAGGVSISLPLLSIEPSTHDWFMNLPNLREIHQLIFISTNAVNYFYKTLELKNAAWPAGIQTIAIGKATANALAKWAIHTDKIPNTADSESLLELGLLQNIKHKTIVLVKGEGGRMDIENTLIKRGAHVIPLAVYRRALPQTENQKTGSLWQDDAVDIILFTSQQAMHNIFTLFETNAHSWLRNKPCLVISERLAHAASLLGIKNIMISRYDTVLNSLNDYVKERAQQSHAAGATTKD